MDKIKYFFECYFNQSADYSDMEFLVKEFNSIESANYIDSIKSELEYVAKNKSWKEFVDIAYSVGGRRIQPENCETFVNNLIQLFKQK